MEINTARSFTFDTNEKTYIKYTTTSSNPGVQFKAEVIAKRNYPQSNRNQRILLQGWRESCDNQSIIDFNACVEYLAEYAPEAEKLSGVGRDAFVCVINVTEASSPGSVLK